MQLKLISGGIDFMQEQKALITNTLSYCVQEKILFEQEVSMEKYTSFRVGGPAQLLISPQNKAELSKLMVFLARESQVPFFLGRGSNLLVGDEGIRRTVIHLSSQFEGDIKLLDSDKTKIFAPAGKKLSELCKFASEHSLTGLEFAYGIPGSVGGAVYMNAGAYGGEVKDVLEQVEYLDAKGTEHRVQNGSLDFSYRHSIFAQSDMQKCCITGTVWQLQPGDQKSIVSSMEDILERRKSKQPLEYPSAGSTFKRPDGAFSSALIDKCGLKGYSFGGAMVSKKHAGFIINYNHATCADILTLVKQVQDIVKEQTGFLLELEIKLV